MCCAQPATQLKVMKKAASKPRANARQALVDMVFRQCMARDERTLGDIRRRVREHARDARGPLYDWATHATDHELQIMISRNCMGEGEWEYFPAYSSPPRYVSRARVRELCKAAEEGRQLTPHAWREMKEQLDDLRNGVAHWRAKHARARQKEQELGALVEDLATRAFAGHHDVLL